MASNGYSGLSGNSKAEPQTRIFWHPNEHALTNPKGFADKALSVAYGETVSPAVADAALKTEAMFEPKRTNRGLASMNASGAKLDSLDS